MAWAGESGGVGVGAEPDELQATAASSPNVIPQRCVTVMESSASLHQVDSELPRA